MERSKKIFVKDCKVKDQVNDIFLIKQILLQAGRDGRNYLNVILTDSSGDLESRVWQNAESLYAQFTRGDYVWTQGKVNQFQGRKQFVINSLEKMDKEQVNEGDFIVSSKFPAHEMYDDLIKIVESLSDFYIQSLLLSVLSDEKIKERLLLWPAGKTIHHAYTSGLLEHVLSCTRLAKDLSAHYKVNENYVVAGAILHDLCKIYELSGGPVVEYTDEGRLIGHLTSGVELIESASRKIPHFPRDTKVHLKHIVLSHHGELAYGSPKLPLTPEAYLVHLVDYLDSKMAQMLELKNSDNLEGPWTQFSKHLERTVYKKELPFYPEEIKMEVKQKGPVVASKKKNSRNPEIKQNLGKLLEGIKLEE